VAENGIEVQGGEPSTSIISGQMQMEVDPATKTVQILKLYSQLKKKGSLDKHQAVMSENVHEKNRTKKSESAPLPAITKKYIKPIVSLFEDCQPKNSRRELNLSKKDKTRSTSRGAQRPKSSSAKLRRDLKRRAPRDPSREREAARITREYRSQAARALLSSPKAPRTLGPSPETPP
jgi:hypothetical protein